MENAFRQNQLKVLVTTQTLAVGVNLPCYLVIIKGSQGYKSGAGYQEYTPSEIFQMLGRAGRPQYEPEGQLVLLTEVS